MRQANKIARRVCYLKLVSNKTAVVLICSSGSNKTTQDILLAEAWRGMGYRKSGQFASLSISLCERHLVFWHYFVIVNILCMLQPFATTLHMIRYPSLFAPWPIQETHSQIWSSYCRRSPWCFWRFDHQTCDLERLCSHPQEMPCSKCSPQVHHQLQCSI